MQGFAPDLIVEATSLCDRQCAGCYAPNVASAMEPLAAYRVNPRLFLEPKAFVAAWRDVGQSAASVAIRGGEPTRHPYIADIVLAASKFSDRIYLETHGRWIAPNLTPQLDPDCTEHFNYLGFMCVHTGTILKLSFDRMHGMTAVELRAATDRLDQRGIEWVIAITETSEDSAAIIAAECPWVHADQLIFQKKVTQATGLYRPPLGVVRVDGTLQRDLSTRFRPRLVEARP